MSIGDNSILVFPDQATLSWAAADRIAAAAIRSVARNGRFLWVISGGGTPKPTYRLLAGQEFREVIPWENTHLFWADERSVAPHHAESNFGQAHQLFIEHVPLPASNVHRIKGELPQEEAVLDYARSLQLLANDDEEWPRFDLAMLGLGGDGHTASLFPGPIGEAEMIEAVISAQADYEGRPADRITLTPRILNLSEEILFLVTGKEKASILSMMMSGPVDKERWPVHRIRPESGTMSWFLDEEAATELKNV